MEKPKKTQDRGTLIVDTRAGTEVSILSNQTRPKGENRGRVKLVRGERNSREDHAVGPTRKKKKGNFKPYLSLPPGVLENRRNHKRRGMLETGMKKIKGKEFLRIGSICNPKHRKNTYLRAE